MKPNYILFDDATRYSLLPLTFTRAVADLRVGILTIREKWENYLTAETLTYTQPYLEKKYAALSAGTGNNIWINASICPGRSLIEEIQALEMNQALMQGNLLVALHSGPNTTIDLTVDERFGTYITKIEVKSDLLRIGTTWDIFTKNGRAIEEDFTLLTAGRTSSALHKSNQVIGSGSIFLEEGARVEGAVLNPSAGPIYIGKDAEIMEGSMVRGPFALGEHAVLKMGAKIYGPTTIGPYSKVGGEVNNSVILGYSNKAHDGFLGNAVIGEWCNLGADSNNSNLKNNYAEVKLWNYAAEKMVGTGLQFCGLIMGDHSKCGINTMFNTGTVVGVHANIFGAGFPPNFIPCFSWGGAEEMTEYRLDKALEVTARVFERRNKKLDETERAVLTEVFKISQKYRNLTHKNNG